MFPLYGARARERPPQEGKASFWLMGCTAFTSLAPFLNVSFILNHTYTHIGTFIHKHCLESG
jgi:hypothetical protein